MEKKKNTKQNKKKKTTNKKKEKTNVSILGFIKKHKLVLIGIITLIIVFIMIYSTTHYGPFKDVKKRIEDKETFVLIISDEYSIKDSYKKMLDYYEDTYNFKYTYVNTDEWPPVALNKLIKITKSDKDTFNYPYLLYIEKGKAIISSNSVTDENTLKKFLINANIIKEEYEEKDYLLNDDEFKDFINSKDGNILFYARNDENIYKYRKELLKANVKCSIIYAERLNNQTIEDELRKMLKLPHDKEFNLPMLIKFKSGKVADYKDNIGINRLITIYKELEKK